MVDMNVNPNPAPVKSPDAWMPTAGGALSIIVGALDLIASLFLGVASCAVSDAPWEQFYTGIYVGRLPSIILGVLAFYLLIVGLLALIGGIFAVRKKNWGLSLAGSIAAFLGGGNIFAILAIIFVAIGKKEFIS